MNDLTVSGVLALYESLIGHKTISSCEQEHKKNLTSAPKKLRLSLDRAKPCSDGPALKQNRGFFRLQTHDAQDIAYAYVMLSWDAPSLGAACLQGRATSGSTGRVPFLWDWCASVAMSAETVNSALYRGLCPQPKLLIFRAASAKGTREWAGAQLSQLRTLAQRSHVPQRYADKINAAMRLRDSARLMYTGLVARQQYERELMTFLTSLENHRVHPLLI